MTNPNLFIVGQPKCGTSSLHVMLGQHPEVFMSSMKEPHFFAADLCSEHHTGVLRRLDDEEYFSLFASGSTQRYRGESSTNYLFSKVAAARIAENCPQAKIIAVFREPVEYLYSFYEQLRRAEYRATGIERTFDKTVEKEELRLVGGADKLRGVDLADSISFERVRFTEQLSRYFQHFSTDQVLVLLYDDLRHDNAATVEKICDFLGISRSFDYSLERVNVSTKVKSHNGLQLVRKVIEGGGPIGATRGALKRLVPSAIRKTIAKAAYNTVLSPLPPLDDAMRLRLKRLFEPEVVRFGKLIGHDLATRWGY